MLPHCLSQWVLQLMSNKFNKLRLVKVCLIVHSEWLAG